MADKTVRFIIRRQPTPDAKPYWEEFDVRWRQGMNVITGLMDIAANPVDRFGKPTTPITYESNCLEEICGSCAMRINGRAAMACSSLVDKLKHPVRLEPLSRYPVVRDLAVDRSTLFENLKLVKAWVPVDGTYDLGAGPRLDPGTQERMYPLSRYPVVRDLAVDRSTLFENLKLVKAWVPVDGTYDLGPGPRVDPETQERMYPLSRCISCRLCLEVCPQVTKATRFVGAAIINQVRLFNDHPTGKALKTERLHAMMGDGGIHECAYAQNCVQICPKNIPLTTSISVVYGQVMKQALGDLLRTPEVATEGEVGHRRATR